MKISHPISVLFIALFISQLTFSQNTRFEINRSINFHPKKDIEPTNIIIKVDKQTVNFFLDISCKVRLGGLTVEIYDPKGEKQGEFSIESQMDKKLPLTGSDENEREIVNGNISKQINEPIKGDWFVKLIPNNTFANILIKSSFRNKD